MRWLGDLSSDSRVRDVKASLAIRHVTDQQRKRSVAKVRGIDTRHGYVQRPSTARARRRRLRDDFGGDSLRRSRFEESSVALATNRVCDKRRQRNIQSGSRETRA